MPHCTSTKTPRDLSSLSLHLRTSFILYRWAYPLLFNITLSIFKQYLYRYKSFFLPPPEK